MFIKYTMGAFYNPLVETTHNYINITEGSSAYVSRLPKNTTTLEIIETNIKFLLATRFNQDNISISENQNSFIKLYRYLNNEVLLQESISVTIITPAHVGETETIVDSALVIIYDSVGKVVETIELSENASKSINKNRLGNTSITITESNIAFVVLPTYIAYVEVESIVDNGSYSIFQPILVPIEDVISVQDIGNKLISKLPKINNTISVSELSSIHIGVLDIGSIALSQHSNETIIETAILDKYEFKLGHTKPSEVLNNYYNLDLSSKLVPLLYTTNFIASGIFIIPPVNIYSGFIVDVQHSYYNPDYLGNLAHNKRLNIHQIKTFPEGAELDFGFIKEDTLMDFTIISGEPYDIQVSEILIPAFFGVILVGLEVGDILEAGQTVEFKVLAYSDFGRTEIDDFLTIHFHGGQKVQIFIKIIRIAVFDLFITPDRGTYQESLSFHTVIFESLNNVRSTKVMMERGKISVKYDVTVFDTYKHMAYLNIFRKGLVQPILHPLWGESLYLTYSENSTYYIEGAWEDCGFAVGDTVFVFAEADRYRLAKIMALSSGKMLLNKKFDIREGYVVCPSFVGVVKGVVATTYTGERFINGSISVDEWELDV